MTDDDRNIGIFNSASILILPQLFDGVIKGFVDPM